jgi:hypothetical protein
MLLLLPSKLGAAGLHGKHVPICHAPGKAAVSHTLHCALPLLLGGGGGGPAARGRGGPPPPPPPGPVAAACQRDEGAGGTLAGPGSCGSRSRGAG